MGIRVNTKEVEKELDYLLEEKVKQIGTEFLEGLMQRGLEDASVLPGQVYVSNHPNGEGETYSLIAEGDDVAFAEFGTGIYASYPQATHSLRAEPGSWSQSPHGKGQFIPGKKEWWVFGNTWTQGEVPMCAMYNAARTIEESIGDEIRNWIND